VPSRRQEKVDLQMETNGKIPEAKGSGKSHESRATGCQFDRHSLIAKAPLTAVIRTEFCPLLAKTKKEKSQQHKSTAKKENPLTARCNGTAE